MSADKKICRYAKMMAKQGLPANDIATKAHERFKHDFKVVNDHLYCETDKALDIVLTKEQMARYQQQVA